MLAVCQAHRGLPVIFLLLRYSVLFAVESLFLLYLLEMFFALLPMVYIFLSLFVLLECALMLMTSTTETFFNC